MYFHVLINKNLYTGFTVWEQLKVWLAGSAVIGQIKQEIGIFAHFTAFIQTGRTHTGFQPYKHMNLAFKNASVRSVWCQAPAWCPDVSKPTSLKYILFHFTLSKYKLNDLP